MEGEKRKRQQRTERINTERRRNGDAENGRGLFEIRRKDYFVFRIPYCIFCISRLVWMGQGRENLRHPPIVPPPFDMMEGTTVCVITEYATYLRTACIITEYTTYLRTACVVTEYGIRNTE
jgi:hypothetical protein